MTNFRRDPDNALGTPASPQAIAPAGSASYGVPIGAAATPGTQAFGTVACRVILGATAPNTNPSVQKWYSLDGTTQILLGGPYLVPITAASASYDFTFDDVPIAAVLAGFAITNGAAQGITAWIQGGVVSLP